MTWHLPVCAETVAWGEGAFIQLWCGYADPHFQMFTECWVHFAQMSCGGNTFPSLRCWAGCQIHCSEEPLQCPPSQCSDWLGGGGSEELAESYARCPSLLSGASSYSTSLFSLGVSNHNVNRKHWGSYYNAYSWALPQKF